MSESSWSVPSDSSAPISSAEIYFPVIDLDLPAAATAAGRFTLSRPATLRMNGWRNDESVHCNSTVTLPLEQFGHWENWLRVSGDDGTATDLGVAFSLEATWGIVNDDPVLSIPLLSSDWNGSVDVEIFGADGTSMFSMTGSVVEVSSSQVDGSTDNPDNAALRGDLRRMLNFLSEAQNESPDDPLAGGLFLHYDHDAQTWRTPNWVWTWGPAISAFLRGAEIFETDAEFSQELRRRAESAAKASIVTALPAGHGAEGFINVRWHPAPELASGVEAFSSPPDTLFLAGWGWIPMYEATGDERYLRQAKYAIDAVDRLTTEFEVVQQDWMGESQEWKKNIVDEAGFGMEGIAAYHRVTGDADVLEVGRRYIDQVIDKLERPDGLWDRYYWWQTGERTETEKNTRGAAWAMEGLLAAHRLLGGSDYLEKARRMADHLVANQLDSGAWAFQFDKPPSDAGLSDKGTGAWTWLLYELHRETEDPQYLEAARRALGWVRAQMTKDGPVEARGGTPGCTPHSGVVYRPWFKISTTYTTSFACAAIIEELRLRDVGRP